MNVISPRLVNVLSFFPAFILKGEEPITNEEGVKGVTKMSKKRQLTNQITRISYLYFRKTQKNVLSLYIKIVGTFCKIWMYRTKARVRVTHRNEINRYEYAANVCTVSYYSIVIGKKCHVLHMIAKISRILSVTKQIYLIMSRLHRSVRLRASYKYESMAPFTNSIIKNNLNRQQITKTEYKLCRNMSEAEVQSAVEHIPGLSGQSVTDMDGINDFAAPSAMCAESDSVQMVYDPVNDTLVPVQKTYPSTSLNRGEQAPSKGDDQAAQTETGVTESDVGEGRQMNPTSTGRNIKDKLNKHNLQNNKYGISILGTESRADTATVTSKTSASRTKEDQVIDQVSRQHEASTSGVDDNDSVSPQFSSDSEDEQPRKKLPHEQIDARIQRQKEKYWKKIGKDADPRVTALVPIHAPKMERLSRLQALKQRALTKPKAKDGDIITGIMHEITKTAEINYSVVTTGADFVMEKDLETPDNVVIATNDPTTARPKPPQMKQSRKDKVLPFPQRRKATLQPASQASKGAQDESDVESDKTWPTDQDDAIPTFRTTSNKRKPKPKQRKKTKQTKKNEKPKRVKAPQKLTKTAVTAMVYKIREPLPMETWDTNLKLEAARTRKLARNQKIRMRQRDCRAKKKIEKEMKASQPQRYVLAEAINLSNILNESDNDSKLVEHLRSLEAQENQQVAQLSQYSSEEEVRGPVSNEDIDAHLEYLADLHTQERSSSKSESDSGEEWRTGNEVVRNPFALRTVTATQQVPASHQGYFTEQGLQRQKERLAAIKRKAGVKSSSVLIKRLKEKDVASYITSFEEVFTDSVTEEPEPLGDMSAKNITKDRSSSRGRAGKQDRFTKGREEQQPEPEDMEQEQANTDEDGQTGANAKGSGKRQRDPPKTGSHDNTTGEDSDDELPGAKRNMTSLREKLTHVYQKKTKETREKRDETRVTPSVAFRVDTSQAGKKVKSAAAPLLEPVKLADAPTLSLKDLVPEQDKYGVESQGHDESFKTDRFVVVERVMEEGEDAAAVGNDRDYEWEIPERNFFDSIMGQAIEKYTEEDWDRIDYLTFSSVGWNTGVGLFAFGSDKLEQMNIFRGIIRTLRIGNKCFESYPKRMLLNRYALTIYFNAAFQWNSELKLLFFIKKLNGFKGELTMAETRFYPDDHPTRKGCKIVACEADQVFLDELYKYPKDHAFSIRFGGNLYIRGGERIDPDDPDAVRQRRPKLTRTAAKKFIQGSGEDKLNDGQRMDDEAAKKARDEHMRKHVGRLLLFPYHTWQNSKRVKQKVFMATLAVVVGKKQMRIFRYIRESKQMYIVPFNMMAGYGKVERDCFAVAAQIKEREKRRIVGKFICKMELNENDGHLRPNANNQMYKLCQNVNITPQFHVKTQTREVIIREDTVRCRSNYSLVSYSRTLCLILLKVDKGSGCFQLLTYSCSNRVETIEDKTGTETSKVIMYYKQGDVVDLHHLMFLKVRELGPNRDNDKQDKRRSITGCNGNV